MKNCPKNAIIRIYNNGSTNNSTKVVLNLNMHMVNNLTKIVCQQYHPVFYYKQEVTFFWSFIIQMASIPNAISNN